MILGKSIYQGNNNLLLGAGYRIRGDIRRKLEQRGYTHVYIMEEGTDSVIPEDIISDEVKLHARAKFTDTTERIKQSFQFQKLSVLKAKELLENGYLKDFNITYGMRRVVEDILRDISEVGAQFMNTMMLKSRDTYFFDHALNTSVLAIIVGRQYKFNRPELKSLALGTFLHDIGKIVIEQLEQNPDNPATLYTEHPTFGYLLLRNDETISPMESQIVNQHHENQDGSGFPIGLRGDNLPPVADSNRVTTGHIFRLAEICSVVNAYDNLVLSERNGSLMTPNQVIKELVLNAGTKFNEHIVQTLSRIVAVYPVGSFVRIVSIIDPTLMGSYGVVARVSPEQPSRPVIIITSNKYKKKIKPIMLDTAKLKSVELELIV